MKLFTLSTLTLIFSIITNAAPLELTCFDHLKPTTGKISIAASADSALVSYPQQNKIQFAISTHQPDVNFVSFFALEGMLELQINKHLLNKDLTRGMAFIIRDQTKMDSYNCYLPTNSSL